MDFFTFFHFRTVPDQFPLISRQNTCRGTALQRRFWHQLHSAVRGITRCAHSSTWPQRQIHLSGPKTTKKIHKLSDFTVYSGLMLPSNTSKLSQLAILLETACHRMNPFCFRSNQKTKFFITRRARNSNPLAVTLSGSKRPNVRGFVNQKINRFKLLLDCIKVEFIRA